MPVALRAAWICGLVIPLDAEPDSPECFSVDHVVPRSHGGSQLGYENVKPAHRLCNALRSLVAPSRRMIAKKDQMVGRLSHERTFD